LPLVSHLVVTLLGTHAGSSSLTQGKRHLLRVSSSVVASVIWLCSSFFWNFFWQFSASCSFLSCGLVRPGHPSGWVPRPSGLTFCPPHFLEFFVVSWFRAFRVFVMAPRSWLRIIDIEGKDFPAGTLSSDVAKWVLEYLKKDHPEFKVVSIQCCPGRVARVTFSKDCVSAKTNVRGSW